AAFWWIGRTPVTAELPQTIRAWASGAVFAALVGWFALTTLTGVMESRFERTLDKEISQRQAAAAEVAKAPKSEYELDWQPFSVEKLKELTAERKTVLVDFTADWCPTCIALENAVLNTKAVKQAVEEHQVETLLADWTERDA